MRLALPLVLATVVLTLAAAPHASAASGITYGLTDDAWLLHGPGTLESRLARLDTLGVQVVRFTLRWDQIARTRPAAPTDPADTAYDWREQDMVLGGLRAHGIEVVIQ